LAVADRVFTKCGTAMQLDAGDATVGRQGRRDVDVGIRLAADASRLAALP
jgi:hypothetical protein